MPEALRPNSNAFRSEPGEPAPADVRRPQRQFEDPLEELARILGEGDALPVRPESVVEVGRRATPTSARPVAHQLSALEAELFDELRSSVTPETRVIRGEVEREVPPIIPQRPADDRDIASLRIDAPTSEEPVVTPDGVLHDTPYSDYYDYGDGVAAGSYDPALVQPPSIATSGWGRAPAPAPEPVHTAPAYPEPTFGEFGREEIARAAEETAPRVARDARILPHSQDEEAAAAMLPRMAPRSDLKIAMVLVLLVVAGGGAYAGWRHWGGSLGAGEPTLIRADGLPIKKLPDPKEATVTDNRPSLTPDPGAGASKIVSLQEDPVDQVSSLTPEGKEIRVINPGAPRPNGDRPHTVKTVVVRPDGTIVSDGATIRAGSGTGAGAAATTAPADATTASPAATAPAATTAPAVRAVPGPVAATPVTTTPVTTTPVTTTPVTPPAPQLTLQLPTVTPPADTAAPVAVDVPVPIAKPRLTPPAVPPKPATVKTVTTTPITVAPRVQEPAGAGAPLALGPVAPRLASAPPPAQPVRAPAPAAEAPVTLAPPPAAGGSGDYVVQIAATKSDADARAAFAAAQRRYSALAGRSIDIQRADLGAKGVFYRARVSAGSRDQAAALCNQVRAQGGQCMVVRR